METNEMASIPEFRFAHGFSADKYDTVIAPDKNVLEITCLTSGKLNLKRGACSENAETGDVICNFHESPLEVYSDSPHSHQTACFSSPAGFGYLHKIPLVIRSPRIYSKCLKLIGDIITVRALNSGDTLRSAGLFLQIAGEISDYGRITDTPPSDLLYAEKAKCYVIDNIGEPVNQRAAAAFLGITPEYLCYVFRRAEGISFIRFSNELKLRNVRDIMITKGLKLSEASALFGFSDPNYVSRLYKKYFGENITRSVRRFN